MNRENNILTRLLVPVRPRAFVSDAEGLGICFWPLHSVWMWGLSIFCKLASRQYHAIIRSWAEVKGQVWVRAHQAVLDCRAGLFGGSGLFFCSVGI
jgi:hypothetical protein